jgi:histidinol phosphatase-like enzyme
MLPAAARSRNLDLSGSRMIGDSDIDIRAGRKAGCRTARFTISHPNGHAPRTIGAGSLDADVNAASLLEAVPQILELRNS